MKAEQMGRKMLGRAVLVMVCAWCPRDTYASLRPGQAYSHGICREHAVELVSAAIVQQSGATTIA